MLTIKKKISALFAVLAAAMAATLMICTAPKASAAVLSGNTANQITAQMGSGWNLGNTLDAVGYGLGSETCWGNPKTTKAMIDAVKKQGFNTVRVPVSWGNHTSGNNYTIDSQWMSRVKEVVDYCIDNDMYVILNIHHDTSTSYYYPSSTYKTQSVKFVKSIWTQVAKAFKDYDQHLIFETLNEPRLSGTDDEWWFPVNNPNSNVLDSIKVINTLNQTAVDAIRASGGNNSDRCIMVPGYCASIDGCTTSAFRMPTDTASNRLIVSVHAYTPYNFALNGNGTAVFSDKLKRDVDYLFNTIKSKFTDKGIPVVIGETSASNKGNSAERIKWAKYYFSKATACGVPCVLWDNNAYNGSNKGECHGHLNRSTLQWYDQSFVDAVISNGMKPISEDMPVSAVSGFSLSSKTNITVTLKWAKNILANGYILDCYDGTKWTTVAKITDNSTVSYTVTGLKASTSYKFRIKAYRGSKTSGFVYLNVNTRPYTTTGFTVSSKTNVTISLKWNKNISASGYVLDRYDGTKWVTIKKFTDNATTSYTVSGLRASTSYKFRIKAYKMYGSSFESSAFTYLNVNTRPYTTTGFNVDSKTNSSVTLKWNKNMSASGYVLDRYDGTKWVTIKKYTSNANTSFTVTGLSSSASYKFRIKAFKMYGSSFESSAFTYLNVNTRPSTVTGFGVSAKTSNSVSLKWNKNTSASGYVLDRYDGTKWVTIKKFTDNTAVYLKISGLSSTTGCKFRIKAYKMYGSSFESSAFAYVTT